MTTDGPMRAKSKATVWMQFLDLLPKSLGREALRRIEEKTSDSNDTLAIIYDAASFAGWCQGYAEGDGAHRGKFAKDPAPPCPHCGEDAATIVALRDENQRIWSQLAELQDEMPRAPQVPQADPRDLDALRELSNAKQREAGCRGIAMHLPSGFKFADDMTREELLEMVYIIDGQRREAADRHESTQRLLSATARKVVT